MWGNLFGWLVLVFIAVFFGFLATRAWRAKNAIVKWVGVIFAALVTLLFAFISLVMGWGLYQLYAPRGNPPPAIQVQGTPEQIARGEHLANGLCVSCHATNGQLPLVGGRDMAMDSPMPIGHLYSINLTPAGPLKNWTDGEIWRALRDGVDKDGRPLLVMSANGVRYLSDEDLLAVIAYLRSQPSVPSEVPDPPDQPNLLLAMMVGAGIVAPRAPVQGPVVAPPKAVTPEYGKYVLQYEDCDVCHGADLNGGNSPVTPNGASLYPVKKWTEEQFISTMRTGVDPDGHKLNAQMPWEYIARLDDVELRALYAYLKSLPEIQTTK